MIYTNYIFEYIIFLEEFGLGVQNPYAKWKYTLER